MVKNKFLVILFFLFNLFTISNNYAITLSRSSEISLLTCGSGDELYSIFGHSAIRIFDPINNIDIVYNYGTFDFNTEHFYLKFAGGRLLYFLNTEEYLEFIESYITDNRTVYEQILNLDSPQKQVLYDLIEENNKPENKYYRYEFFYDNCTTRIRDIILKALDNKIDFTKYIPPPIPTYRKMISHYIRHLKWTDLGIDLLFGLPTDHKMNQSEYMFLPTELMNAFDNATINGDSTKLVKETKALYIAADKNDIDKEIFSPLLVFWSLFILFVFITFFEIWKKFDLWLFDFLLFFIAGLLGLLIATLWIGSTYVAVRFNFVLIWAIPFHSFMAFFIKRKKSKFVKKYFLMTFVLMILLLISWFFLPQEYNTASFPLVLLLTIRAFKIYYLKSKEKTRRTNIYYK